MWQVMYKCAVVGWGCYPVRRMANKHPLYDPEAPPLCTDHELPMVMLSYTPPISPRLRPARPKIRKGGFKTQQPTLY